MNSTSLLDCHQTSLRTRPSCNPGWNRSLLGRSAFLAGLLLFAAAQQASAQVTAFTYQGRLTDGPNVANGRYDLSFSLFDALNGGTALGSVVSLSGVNITNGVFTVPLDFGANVFDGGPRWLEVGVRTNSFNFFDVLQPRIPVQAVPQAIRALRADSLTSPLDADSLPVGVVRTNQPNIFTQPTFLMGPVGVGTYSVGSFPAVFAGSGVNDDYVAFQSRTNASTRWHLTGVLGGLNIVETGVADFRMFFAPGGNVGVGTASPDSRLHVNGATHSSGRVTADENLIVKGRLGVGTDNPAVALHVNGEATVKVLNITGGSDIAEPFELLDGDQPTPGSVVCIDPSNPGRVRLSRKAHDRTVAGILSGAGGVNPGLMLTQPGTLANGTHPVALSGRVYCWVDADAAGPVEPGDLLTSSDTPGHAMRMGDPARGSGAILGKAMTRLEKGRGLVLVLVSLQ